MKNYRLNYLSKQDKDRLKTRIQQSINVYDANQRKVRIRQVFKYAAIFVVLLGTGLLYVLQTNTVSDLEKSVSVISPEVLKYGDVRLVFNSTDEIKVKESSSIIYSQEGKVKLQPAKEGVEVVEKESEKEVYNEIIVPYGKRTQITLSEGTKIWLNSGSRMVYPPVFKGEEREVYLEGEAIFEVAHNPEKPFFVETKDYRVKVLGTVFNLSSYPDDTYASTALESGKVEISYKSSLFGRSTKQITKGTLAIYDRKSKDLEAEQTNIRPYMTWREGYWEIQDQKLTRILKKLSRYYRADLVIENTSKNFNDMTFSGYLDLKNDIEEVLKVISETSNMAYFKTSDNKILIK